MSDELVGGVRRRAEANRFWRHLGIEVAAAREGWVQLRVSVRDELRNAAGAPVHGGVLSALVDMAVGGALSTLHEASEGGVGQTTLDLNVSFIGAAGGDEIVAEGRILKKGRTIAFGEATVTDANGRLVAVGRATYMITSKGATSQARLPGATAPSEPPPRTDCAGEIPGVERNVPGGFGGISMMTARGVATVQIDNATVRVTEWRFIPGAATGHHRHEFPYVVVPLTSGRLAITGADGMTGADLIAGQTYFRPAGVEHDVRNANAFEFVFVEIELKVASGSAARTSPEGV